MRPQEVDFANTTNHYIDVLSGEVLAGEQERAQYCEAGASPATIHNLGRILRDKALALPYPDQKWSATQDWPEDTYKMYGKWLYAIVESPADPNENILNQTVINNARRIGLGPGAKTLRRIFTTLGNFYYEIEAADAKKIGLFDDWTLEDVLAYIRQKGGDRPPSHEDLRVRKGETASGPDYQYLRRRYHEIGGVTALLELAGYTAVRGWDRDDYVQWGVRFMQVNDGIVPTRDMVRYFSKLKKGPCCTTIDSKFDTLTDYQNVILDEWRAAEKAKNEERQAKIAQLTKDISTGKLPEKLINFSAKANISEALRRAGEYKVLCAVYPDIAKEAKVKICSRTDKFSEYKNLHACIRRYFSNRAEYGKTAGDLERAALILDVFDDIWPMESHLSDLKLSKDFIKYREKKRKRPSSKPYVLPAPAVIA